MRNLNNGFLCPWSPQSLNQYLPVIISQDFNTEVQFKRVLDVLSFISAILSLTAIISRVFWDVRGIISELFFLLIAGLQSFQQCWLEACSFLSMDCR